MFHIYFFDRIDCYIPYFLLPFFFYYYYNRFKKN